MVHGGNDVATIVSAVSARGDRLTLAQTLKGLGFFGVVWVQLRLKQSIQFLV